MWKNIVEPERPQMTIWHMFIACWIPKAKSTHSEYVILTAFHCNNGCTNASHCYVYKYMAVWLIVCLPGTRHVWELEEVTFKHVLKLLVSRVIPAINVDNVSRSCVTLDILCMYKPRFRQILFNFKILKEPVMCVSMTIIWVRWGYSFLTSRLEERRERVW